MTEEEKPECKLTYREGQEIRREMGNRYAIRACVWLILSGLLMGVFIILADWRFDVLWQGVEVLKDRALQGDIQAIFDYMDYKTEISVGAILSLIVAFMAFVEMYVGEMKIAKALKEANEGKE